MPSNPLTFSQRLPSEADVLLLQLVRQYPEQFSASHVDVQPLLGWLPIFARLCDEVSKLPENAGGYVQWLQIKEKLCSMRARYRIAPGLDKALAEGLREKVWALCENARAASESCCQICSGQALKTAHPMEAILCECHRAQRIQNPERFERDFLLGIEKESLQIALFQKILLHGVGG